MQNVNLKTEKGKIIIEIDTTKRFGASKSGKTEIVASTQGNQIVPGTDIVLGLNAYIPISKS